MTSPVDMDTGGAEDRWSIVDSSLWTDDEVRESGAPRSYIKVTLDNGGNPWNFRMGSFEGQREDNYDRGVVWFNKAWDKYANTPPLVPLPGPCVRALVTEWGYELKSHTGITASPIGMIILLHNRGLLIDRSSPNQFCMWNEKKFIPACQIATKALKELDIDNESSNHEDVHVKSMKRVVLKKALQDAYPGLKSP